MNGPSLFRCPLCGSPLTQEERGCICPARHSFDRAAAGYVHLLPPNRMHSKAPGDDREMVAARAAFLERGYYAPLRQALEELVLEASAHLEGPVLLDSGCGEGYYTAGMFRALERAGHRPRAAGIDISKYALRRAAKRLPEGEFAVASAYRLPLADASADLLTNVFSPLSAEEFARVLRPGGTFLYVVPSARHLWEMKQVLYSQPYENPVKETPYTGFSYQRIVPVRYEITLDCPEDIRALFQMTPYCWKTPREGVEALSALKRLTTQVGFDLHVFRRSPT